MEQDILYRCSECRQVVCTSDFKISPYCPVCCNMKFSRARIVTDDEMRAAIQRGFKYDERDFDYVDDNLLRKGIVPTWINEVVS